MNRHRLKFVIVVLTCLAVANPVLAGWHDSRVALLADSGASAAVGAADCPRQERADG